MAVRISIILIAMGWLAGLCGAAQSPRDDSAAAVRAATSRAIDDLFAQVGQAPLGHDLTVRRFLDRAEATEDMRRLMERAEQVGGPRWIDDHTCQVQLEIRSTRVMNELKRIAAAHPDKALASPQQIDRAAGGWDRVFSTTGVSSAARVLTQVEPVEAQSWHGVAEKDRQAALEAARQDAISRLVESVQTVEIGERTTFADAMDRDAVANRVWRWLESRPVTHVEFRDGQQVKVSLGTSADELFNVVRSAVEAEKGLPHPANDEGWAQVKSEFVGRLARPVGYATARAGGAGAGGAGLSRQAVSPAPAWVAEQVEVVGTAAPADSKLKTARAAEADAFRRLRLRVLDLRLNDRGTLGEAATRDQRLAAAVDRALGAAQVTRTEYLSDGGAKVWLVLQLQDFWQQLEQ